MKHRESSMDMLHGPLTGKLIWFAMPIAASSMLQQLFNAADTAVVGRFADANALAAVGTNGEIVALLVSLSLGLAVGVNVLLARLIGSDQQEVIPEAVHRALGIALLLGGFGAIVGQWLARPLLTLIHTPEGILEQAVLYLRIYFAGYPSLMLYDFGAGILRAKGDSRRPFVILTASGVLNVLLNLVFVIAFGMGVAGVAVATDLASCFAAAGALWLLHRENGAFHVSIRKLTCRSGHSSKLLQIGIPAALQGAVFCFANIFVQASVNRFGEIAAAGSAIAMNFEYFGYYMITAFGQAATTFTSQNYAAGNQSRCNRVLWLCLLGSVVCSAVITVPLTAFRSGAAGLFTQDPAVARQAGLRILLILLFEPICGFYEVPAGYLRGMGYSNLPAVLTILGTCLLRIVWIETVFRRIGTLQSLFVVFPISWVVTAILMWGAMLWNRGRQRHTAERSVHQ